MPSDPAPKSKVGRLKKSWGSHESVDETNGRLVQLVAPHGFGLNKRGTGVLGGPG